MIQPGSCLFTWSVSAGTLPAGVTLGASTGLLSGTPTTSGGYSFTVKVTDHSGLSDTEAVTLPIIAAGHAGLGRRRHHRFTLSNCYNTIRDCNGGSSTSGGSRRGARVAPGSGLPGRV